MKTAVEWFAEKIGHNSLMALTEYNEILDQAKAMEKEQIIEAFEHIDFNLDDGLHYYTQTYESNN